MYCKTLLHAVLGVALIGQWSWGQSSKLEDDQLPAVVAEQLGVKVDSVYQTKSRVLKQLQQELKGVPI